MQLIAMVARCDCVICLSPDGSKVAIISESQTGLDIQVYKTGTRLCSLRDEPGTRYWLAWSADNRRVAMARDNGGIALWDLDAVGQILAKLGLN